MIHASSEQEDSSACLQKLLESLLWSHHNTRDESARFPVQRIFVALAHSQGDVGAAISDSHNANLSHWTAAMQYHKSNQPEGCLKTWTNMDMLACSLAAWPTSELFIALVPIITACPQASVVLIASSLSYCILFK